MFSVVYLTIKLGLNYLASHIKQLGMSCTEQNRTHEKPWLRDPMGCLLSHSLVLRPGLVQVFNTTLRVHAIPIFLYCHP